MYKGSNSALFKACQFSATHPILVCMHSIARRDSNKQLGSGKNCETVSVKEY